MRNSISQSIKTNKSSWLVGVLVLVIALSSCTPSLTPEVETPTLTTTNTLTLTRTATPVPENTPTPTRPAHLEITPDDLVKRVVRFAHPWIGEPAETLERIAMEFSLTNPWDIWVEAHSYGGETALVEALSAELEASELPGLIAIHPYQLSALNEGYDLVELSAYYNDPDWGLDADTRADILPVFVEPFMLGNQIIALPFAPEAMVLFYNQTWGESLGFSEPPNDLITFRNQSCEATFFNWQLEEKQDGTGGWLINMDPMVIASWYYAFEGVLPGADLPRFNDDIGQDAFGYLWDIKNQGCTWFARQPEPYLYFANRFALMYAGRLDQIPKQMNWMAVAESEDNWVVIGFPGPAGETMLVDGPGLMVTADSPENQLASWLFAKYLLEPKVQAKLVQSLFTLPVRESALDLLDDFKADYPQWGQAAAMVGSASSLPISDAWGISQWALQDAVFRILQSEDGDIPVILEQLDDMIEDLAGASR